MIVADLYQREGGDAEATILALCKLEELYPYRNIELTKMVFGLPAVTTIPQNKPFHFSLNSYYIDLKLPQTNLDWFDFYEHGYYNSSRLAKSCQIRFGYFPEELGFVACQTITCAHEWCHCLQVQGEYGTTKHSSRRLVRKSKVLRSL
ncbi:MAG: hypothetical protein NTW50_04260 [Candidatus Berkelbacteria bacterium]|nr:hypothetical protein [Candidatus Berkelbacteria bacterium]